MRYNKIINRISVFIIALFIIFVNVTTYSESVNETLNESEDLLEEETENIKAEDIDLGDYLDIMTVGDRQLLSITVLPLDTSEKEVTFTSSNTNVATINALGRITALSQGETTISVNVGTISKSFLLKVQDKENSIINVTDIEISGYEEELEIGKSFSLTSTVIPSNATESSVIYKSSDTNIATVSSNGEVKGISKGKVTITASAGGFSKNISINVIVATTGIEIDKTYLVLKAGESYKLNATVTPKDANQNLTFISADENVATVSSDGMVMAKSTGSTAVIISNGDYTSSVSVIVNKPFSEQDNKIDNIDDKDDKDNKNVVYDKIINVSEQDIITKDILKDIYEKNKIIKIIGYDYKITIDGKYIVNYNNEFLTDITLIKKNDDLHFNINDGKDLCGNITLYLDNNDYKYLYLYNDSKEQYEEIDMPNSNEISISSPGKYMLTNKILNISIDNIVFIILICLCVVVIGFALFLFVRKKYLFW